VILQLIGQVTSDVKGNEKLPLLWKGRIFRQSRSSHQNTTSLKRSHQHVKVYKA